NDIRRALTEVGRGPFFSLKARTTYGLMVDELTRATARLAERRIGALIVLEREVGLSDYMEAGTTVDAVVSKELIESIFLPTGPLHDGALVVRQGRIVAAGCILPLTTNPNVTKALGTRHRAAIGITEETDAVVIVVSEEEGSASLVSGGQITRNLKA